MTGDGLGKKRGAAYNGPVNQRDFRRRQAIMYAIIRSGGKQSKVSAGDVIDVELLKGAAETVSFTPLLVVDGEGKAVTDRSRLEEMPVMAEVEGEVRGDKLDIFKYKNKSGYRRRMGHRQRYTRLRIVSIGGAGEDPEEPANEPAGEPEDGAFESGEPENRESENGVRDEGGDGDDGSNGEED